MADHDMTCGPALSSNMPVGQSGRRSKTVQRWVFRSASWSGMWMAALSRGFCGQKQCDRALGQLQDVSRATLGLPANHGSPLVPNCRGDPFVLLTSATGAPWCLFRHVSGVPRLI